MVVFSPKIFFLLDHMQLHLNQIISSTSTSNYILDIEPASSSMYMECQRGLYSLPGPCFTSHIPPSNP